MKKGYFVTFEGGEGTGKSTQCRLLSDYLTQKGKKPILTREPGGSVGAEEIRNLLVTGDENRWDSVTETLLFMAARRNHLVQKIWPALEADQVVICDRFLDSTLAYQGYGYGKDQKTLDMIRTIYRLIAGDFYPDLTIILDIDPQEGLRRSYARAGNTEQRFESKDLSFHHNLRQGFLDLARSGDRYVIVDASATIEQIHNQICQIVQERLFS